MDNALGPVLPKQGQHVLVGVPVVDADGVVKLFCKGKLGGEDLPLPFSGRAVGPMVVKAYLTDGHRVSVFQPDP